MVLPGGDRRPAVRSNVARWIVLLGISVSLSPGVLQWNAMITPSLSVSALCAGFVLFATSFPARAELAWFVSALAFFAFTRDTNALVVGGLAIIAIGCAFRRSLRVPALVVGAAGLTLAISASALSNAADPPRWYWPVAETTAVRLLDDPVATRYLVDHGFPWSSSMRTLPERYIYLYGPVRHGPTFAAFRHWVGHDGRRTYAHFLLSHPGWALRKPFDDRGPFFDLGTIEVYGRTYRNRPGGPYTAIGSIGGPRAPGVTEVWALAAGLELTTIRRRGDRRLPVFALTGDPVGRLLRRGTRRAGGVSPCAFGRGSVADRLVVSTALVVDALVAGPVTSGYGTEDADLDQQQHQGAPRDEPAGAVADLGADGGERAR